MDMDQAAVFLAGSILTMLGFVIVAIGIIVINNLIAKYWKNLGWFHWHLNHESARFATDEELKTLDNKQESKIK